MKMSQNSTECVIVLRAFIIGTLGSAAERHGGVGGEAGMKNEGIDATVAYIRMSVSILGSGI
jgi:hypothetical protein